MACTGSPQLRAARVNAANRCASTEEGSIWRRYPLPCRTTSCPAPMAARALRSLETRICRALDGSSGSSSSDHSSSMSVVAATVSGAARASTASKARSPRPGSGCETPSWTSSKGPSRRRSMLTTSGVVQTFTEPPSRLNLQSGFARPLRRRRSLGRRELVQPDPLVETPQSPWCPPVQVTQQRHGRRHEEASDDGRVDEHGYRQCQTHLLDAQVVPGGEAEEHDPHQHCSGGDDPTGPLQPVGDRVVTV